MEFLEKFLRKLPEEIPKKVVTQKKTKNEIIKKNLDQVLENFCNRSWRNFFKKKKEFVRGAFKVRENPEKNAEELLYIFFGKYQSYRKITLKKIKKTRFIEYWISAGISKKIYIPKMFSEKFLEKRSKQILEITDKSRKKSKKNCMQSSKEFLRKNLEEIL